MMEINLKYRVAVPRNYMENPLCMATNHSSVEEKLLLCPDNVTNKTQLEPLLKYSDIPFIELMNVDPHAQFPVKCSINCKDRAESTKHNNRKSNRVSSSVTEETKVYVKEMSMQIDTSSSIPGTQLEI